MQKRYYTELQKIAMRSRRKKERAELFNTLKEVAKFLGFGALFYGWVWMMCVMAYCW